MLRGDEDGREKKEGGGKGVRDEMDLKLERGLSRIERRSLLLRRSWGLPVAGFGLGGSLLDRQKAPDKLASTSSTSPGAASGCI